MQTAERGEKAKRILDDSVFKQAQDEAANALFDRWILSDNADEREALWHTYQALDCLPRQLRIYADRAKAEEIRSAKD